jgi:predicted Zn-dependent peptidase
VRKGFPVLLLLGLMIPLATIGSSMSIGDKLVHRTLSNGMTILMVPRSGAPEIGAVLYVDAGSAEEGAGETGLAHLLEHMAFKGTPYIGTTDWDKEQQFLMRIEEVGTSLTRARQAWPQDAQLITSLTEQLRGLQRQVGEITIRNEYDRIITREGGQAVNATTSVDFTNYFMTIPSNRLEMWALMESQRLSLPAWREFYEERDVVAEERRMRTEDNPIGRLYEEFLTTAFRAHPYKNPTIGWMSDIESLTITRTADFYRRWYVPEAMTVVLVGNFDPEKAMPILEKYFGSLPAGQKPSRSHTLEPPQTGLRRANVVFDAQPQILLGWKKPTFPHPDQAVFEVIQYLLTSSGRLSRLYDRLVTREGLASDISSFTAPGDKYPNLLCIYATPKPPTTTEQLEAAILAEVARLTTEPVTMDELQRVRNQIQASFLKSVESNLGLARQLGYYYVCSGDPNILDTMNAQMQAVTPEDIQRVAQLFLVEQNLTVATLRQGEPNRIMPARPEAALAEMATQLGDSLETSAQENQQ